MSRYALPLILNTVNSFTASPVGNSRRTSIRFFQTAFFAIRYQTSGGAPSSACVSAGCYSQGKTVSEALANIREAIDLCIEDMDSTTSWKNRCEMTLYS